MAQELEAVSAVIAVLPNSSGSGENRGVCVERGLRGQTGREVVAGPTQVVGALKEIRRRDGRGRGRSRGGGNARARERGVGQGGARRREKRLNRGRERVPRQDFGEEREGGEVGSGGSWEGSRKRSLRPKGRGGGGGIDELCERMQPQGAKRGEDGMQRLGGAEERGFAGSREERRETAQVKGDERRREQGGEIKRRAVHGVVMLG